MNSLDGTDKTPPAKTAESPGLSEFVFRELAANKKATQKLLAQEREDSAIIAEQNEDEDRLRPKKGPVAERSSDGDERISSPWGQVGLTPRSSYRLLTSIELVTAICVAAVGLAHLRGNKGRAADVDEKTSQSDALVTNEIGEEMQALSDTDLSKEQSEWADLERGLNDSTWITENAKRKPLGKVKNEVVVCSFDRNLNFVSFSDALCSRWGYEPSDLIGHNIIGLVRTEDVNTTLEALREVVANKTGIAFENWLRHKSGKWMAMSWSAYWSDTDNKVVAIARDITAEKEVERLRQETVQMVSHDLRSPLTSIQFSLEMLAQGASGALSEEALEDVRIAQNNTTQLINLVNDLLDLEKIEHGMLRMNLGGVKLNEILQTAMDNVRFLAKSRKIEIKSEATDLVVFADKDRIVQVIVNMLSNAVKFSPESSVVAIECQARDGWAEVRVTDQGPGIPARYKDAIFERFKQIEGQQNNGQKGAGLGLAICKSIIEGHKGKIGVESRSGKGSTFWFRVPLFEKRESNTPFGKVGRRLGFQARASS